MHTSLISLCIFLHSPASLCCIPLHLSASLCIPLHSPAFPCISLLYSSAFLYIPLHPFTSLCIPLHPFTSLHIPLHPSTSLYIPLHPSTSLCMTYPRTCLNLHSRHLRPCFAAYRVRIQVTYAAMRPSFEPDSPESGTHD